jgi:hypothetical protein
MAGWLNRLLAAIGAGGRKSEADVSYDPAVQGSDRDRAPELGDSGQGDTSEKIPR